MPFEKGKPRPKNAGRRAGTPNKASFTDLRKICEDLGVEPFEEMLRIGMNARDESIRLAAYKECSKYLYSQKRAVEVSGNKDNPLNVDVESSKAKEILADLRTLIDTKVNERKG